MFPALQRLPATESLVMTATVMTATDLDWLEGSCDDEHSQHKIGSNVIPWIGRGLNSRVPTEHQKVSSSNLL